jgi:hypothetical protein
VLVRVYTTRPLGDLPAELQRFARESWGGTLDSDTRCLVLLGSVGLEPDWCNRTTSRGHKAIPLPSADAVARLPMVASLVGQLGISVAEIVRQGPALAMVDPSERTYNVFHVESAAGSPYIPAQDFVERYAVRSVLGCGGLLPDGELYAAILFSRMGIGEETADLFRPLALALKLALIPFKKGRIFRDESSSADAAV